MTVECAVWLNVTLHAVEYCDEAQSDKLCKSNLQYSEYFTSDRLDIFTCFYAPKVVIRFSGANKVIVHRGLSHKKKIKYINKKTGFEGEPKDTKTKYAYFQ